MLQNEFNQFYDSLKNYAHKRATNIFYDMALRNEAIDNAMDRVVDWLIKNPNQYPVNYCKTIIANSLYNSSTRGRVKSFSLQGTLLDKLWGFRGRKFKDS